jgi:hypothetical protein
MAQMAWKKNRSFRFDFLLSPFVYGHFLVTLLEPSFSFGFVFSLCRSSFLFARLPS